MKYSILFLVTLMSVTFLACNEDEASNETCDAPTLAGTWNLSNVSGGFAGVDTNFEDGLIIWTFNIENSQVSVVNNNEEDSLFDGFPTGTYDYVLDQNSDPETLTIDFLSADIIELSHTQMVLDEGIAFDGFLLTFTR